MTTASREVFPRKVEQLLCGRGALLAGFIWGFAEGLWFFIVPDLIITLVALFSRRSSVKQIVAVLVGSLLAGSILYFAGRSNFESSRNFVASVPFVTEEMFATTQRQLARSGAWALCEGPLSGIPYKVYAVQASAYSPFLIFLLLSIPARLERFLISWCLFAVVGELISRYWRFSPRCLILGHMTYWAVVYMFYWNLY